MTPKSLLCAFLLALAIALLPLPAETVSAGEPAAVAAAGQGIPDHPDRLSYPPMQFRPPEAAAHRRVLPSGVVTFVVEDHELPLVDVQVHVRCGTYLDPIGKEGLSVIVSDLLRSGGTEKNTPEEFDEELAFLAAEVGTAQGDLDASASFNCLSKDIDRVLELFFDMLRAPRFDPDRLALQKSQDLQELARRNDRTPAIERREWERQLRGPGFFTTDRVTQGSLGAIAREDLIAFHRQHYHPRNFVVAVSGDVKTREILDRLEGYFGHWPGADVGATPAPPPPKPTHAIEPGLYIVDKPDVNQGRVSMGHLSAMRSSPDYHALQVMNLILGAGGFTSRILSRVRSDEGLAYSAGCDFEFGDYFDGEFRGFFQSKSESVLRATGIVLEEIERMRSTDVSRAELETAVNYAIGSFPRFFSNCRAVAGTFAMDELRGRDPAFWTTYQQKLEAVTAADVRRVAERYLRPDGMVVLIVGQADAILSAGGEAGKSLVEKLAREAGVRRIPLPDPLTLQYPQP